SLQLIAVVYSRPPDFGAAQRGVLSTSTLHSLSLAGRRLATYCSFAEGGLRWIGHYCCCWRSGAHFFCGVARRRRKPRKSPPLDLRATHGSIDTSKKACGSIIGASATRTSGERRRMVSCYLKPLICQLSMSATSPSLVWVSISKTSTNLGS